MDGVPDHDVPHIHIPNSVPLTYEIDPYTGGALQQDTSPLTKSKGTWLLSEENQERLVSKLGVDSESFARSLFTAWDDNEDGYLSRAELGNHLFDWRRDANPAISALAGKILEEVRKMKLLGNANLKVCLFDPSSRSPIAFQSVEF